MGAPVQIFQRRSVRLAGIGDFTSDFNNAVNAATGSSAAQAASQAAQQFGLPDPNASIQQVQAYVTAIQNLIAHPDQLIKSITIDTTHLPSITMVDPLKPAPPGAGSAIAHALKPRLTIAFNPIAATTLKPFSYAQYGDPGPTDFDTWATVGAFVGAGVAGVLGLGLISILKRRGGKVGLLRRWLAARKARRAGLSGVRRVHGRRVR